MYIQYCYPTGRDAVSKICKISQYLYLLLYLQPGLKEKSTNMMGYKHCRLPVTLTVVRFTNPSLQGKLDIYDKLSLPKL